MQTTYQLPNGRSAVRKAAIGRNADLILPPKRKVSGTQNRARQMQTAYPLRNGRSAVRKAPIESNADCIPTPKRKVCGSQSSNRKQCRPHTHSKMEGLRFTKLQSKAMQTAYPLPNGRFAVRKIALGGCRPHTHSQTEGQRCAKSRSADADCIPTPKRKVSGSQNRARRMQHEVRSRFTPEHGEGVCFST